jgi:dephospho-CoA kinase
MLKVGITGGIGSGKSTVCALFELLGVPVFYADDAAKQVMDDDIQLKAGISGLFGADIYVNGKLDRPALSKAVFGSPDKLAALNALVHPTAINAGEAWMARQQAPYVIKEAAIFFESGSNKPMDLMIGVSAPEELRIQRAVKRGLGREEVQARISRQMNEDEKMRRCDYVVLNDDLHAVIPQVLSLHQIFTEKGNSKH